MLKTERGWQLGSKRLAAREKLVQRDRLALRMRPNVAFPPTKTVGGAALPPAMGHGHVSPGPGNCNGALFGAGRKHSDRTSRPSISSSTSNLARRPRFVVQRANYAVGALFPLYDCRTYHDHGREQLKEVLEANVQKP